MTAETLSGALTPGDWIPFAWDDGLTALVGPVWTLAIEDSAEELLRVGFRVGKQHCNRIDTCHGGMLSMVMDTALGLNCNLRHGMTVGVPTVTLTLDFLRSASIGEWVESRCNVLRMTRNLGFAEGRLVTAKGVIVRGNGVFKLLKLEPAAVD